MTTDNKTRLFFVVDSAESERELFETQEQAEAFALSLADSQETDIITSICIVRNAYKEDDGQWNYNDLSDTFQEVEVLTHTNPTLLNN